MENTSSLTALQRFFRLIKGDRKEISYIYIYAIFAGIINLSLPLGVQAILNFIQGGAISSSWWLLIGVVTAGTFLAGSLVIMQMTISETLQRRIFTRVSFDFAERLPNLRTESIRREHVPELVNRFFDTLNIQKGLPKILIDLSTALMQIVFGLLLLSFYHPLFIFFGLVLVIMLILIFRFTYPSGIKTSLQESKYKYEVAYWLEELGRTLHTFKLAGKSELPLSKTDQYVSNYLNAKEKHFKILLIQYVSIVTFKTLVTFILLSLGSWLVINNQINIGQFVAAELIILLILSSSEKLITTMETVYDVLTAIEKIGLVADIPLDSEKGIDFDKMHSEKGIQVELHDVSHRFKDSQKYTFKNINLNIKAGEKVCIAGYNGSGKTTLVQIISCFLNDYEGAILYNNIPRNNFNQRTLRSHIGDFSSQEDIFKGTLLENIALGNPNISFNDIVKVTEAVNLMPFVSQLPNGFDTVLLPEGKNLPRSIVAKIILSRSIVSKPKLLAIEELMANIELEDRVRIAELLTRNGNDWTLVAVTDDPILAYECDRVLIMKDGEIVEEGTFDEIQKSPHYVKVFKVYGEAFG
jgi:ABC-type bacteriocin/lantibiotic exporter with double-glycine peptidase domain